MVSSNPLGGSNFRESAPSLESRRWVTIAFYADEALVVTSPRLGKTMKINAMERQRT
jgi:hypothetical protein